MKIKHGSWYKQLGYKNGKPQACEQCLEDIKNKPTCPFT